MREEGVTLTELLVAISVVAVLAVALGFTFQGWMGKYKIENEVKILYSDLMDTRTKAMTRNRMYFIVLNAGNYREYADTNNNNAPNVGAGDLPEPEFTNPKLLEYSSGWTGRIQFDTRGLALTVDSGGTVSTTATIVLNIPADTDPDYDCIHVYQSRIRMGKFNGTTSTCVEK